MKMNDSFQLEIAAHGNFDSALFKKFSPATMCIFAIFTKFPILVKTN